MMNFSQTVKLGRTDLLAGRLGISSSYGAPAEAFEEAFERGCNYFTWGTFIKGRSKEMKKAIRNIIMKGQREKLILAMYSYSHSSLLTDKSIKSGLKKLGIEYADVLILGYFPRQPNRRIIDGALRLKEKGIIRYLALSGHNRKLFPELLKEGVIDIFHVRYNAVNRGA
jgi:predicted aldo/keto reductase-like oxidoreductase